MIKEYIEREAALDAITYRTIIEPTESDIVALTLAVAQNNIRKISAADVVEVTRCKDCKHCDKYTKWNNQEYLGCNFNCDITEVAADHYCSYGKKKNETTESWIITENGCVITCPNCGERLELCYPDGTEVRYLPHCPWCGKRLDR